MSLTIASILAESAVRHADRTAVVNGPARITYAELWDEARRYLAWTPLPTDEALLRGAREVERRYKLGWWDSMAVAAAQLQDCAILASEDLEDGMSFGALKVRNPFTSVLEEPLAAYLVQAAPLHRPRGRPRRLAA